MEISAAKSPSSDLTMWVVGGFIGVNLVGGVFVGGVYIGTEMGVLTTAQQPIVVLSMVPALLVLVVVVIMARMRTLRPENGIDIHVGSDLEIHRKKTGKVLLRAPRTDLKFRFFDLAGTTQAYGTGMKNGAALGITHLGKEIVIGAYDPSIGWRKTDGSRTAFGWVCDGATLRKLIDALGLAEAPA